MFWAEPLATLSSARRLGPTICMRITLPCLPHSISTILIHTISCKPEQKDTDCQQDGGCVEKNWPPIQGQGLSYFVWQQLQTLPMTSCHPLVLRVIHLWAFEHREIDNSNRVEHDYTWLRESSSSANWDAVSKKEIKTYKSNDFLHKIWSENLARLCLCKDLSKYKQIDRLALFSCFLWSAPSLLQCSFGLAKIRNGWKYSHRLLTRSTLLASRFWLAPGPLGPPLAHKWIACDILWCSWSRFRKVAASALCDSRASTQVLCTHTRSCAAEVILHGLGWSKVLRCHKMTIAKEWHQGTLRESNPNGLHVSWEFLLSKQSCCQLSMFNLNLASNLLKGNLKRKCSRFLDSQIKRQLVCFVSWISSIHFCTVILQMRMFASNCFMLKCRYWLGPPEVCFERSHWCMFHHHACCIQCL